MLVTIKHLLTSFPMTPFELKIPSASMCSDMQQLKIQQRKRVGFFLRHTTRKGEKKKEGG